MLGYSRDEVVGRVRSQILRDADEVKAWAEELSAQLGRPVAPGFEVFVAPVPERGASEREWIYVRKDGTRLPVSLSITALRDGCGEITGFLGVARDLTPREATAAELRASRERLNTIFNSVTVGIVFENADGVIVESNPVAERILGLTHDQMAGLTSFDPRWRALLADGTPCPGDQHPAVITLRTGRPQRDVVMGVCRGDGSLVWVLVNSEPMPGADGRACGVVVSFADITERKLADEKLDRSERFTRTMTDGLPA